MAPTRIASRQNLGKLQEQQGVSGKRKAELSPIKNERAKRCALGNLTNALTSEVPKNATKVENPLLKPISSRTRAAAKSHIQGSKKAVVADLLPPPSTKVTTTAVKAKPTTEVSQRNVSRRISNEFEKTEESLYVSALEEIPSDVSRLSDSLRKHESSSSTDSQSSNELLLSSQTSSEEEHDDAFSKELGRPPPGVENFDKENWNDPYQVSNYASEIFKYLKTREPKYKIKDYMSDQPELSKWMRSLLVDWMVEVQESFELNHETLYLAVKIVDTYLGKERVAKDSLQLLGAAALLIACKYDERTPPLIDDFLFICDGAYKRSQLLKMEITVFKSINFDLAFPLSYRFLRRYARCGKISMVSLTLARYILEFSLMDYSTIQLSDSKLACAALFMSLRMNDMEGWNATYEYYSGYKLIDFAPIVVLLNSLLHRKPKETLSTVRNKYSHKIFHQVTSIPMLDINKLFESFPDVAKKLSGSQLTYQSIIAACSSNVPSKESQKPKAKAAGAVKKGKSMPLPLIG